MGTFLIDGTVVNAFDRARSAVVPQMLVDAGSEYTWVPRDVLDGLGIEREKKDLEFQMANGQVITRSVGFAILRVEPYFTIDEVVLAQANDLKLLGARTLEGLNLKLDSQAEKLVASGPCRPRPPLLHTNDVASTTTR